MNIDSSIKLFADDCIPRNMGKLLIKDIEMLQNNLNTLAEWAGEKVMKIIPCKIKQ